MKCLILSLGNYLIWKYFLLIYFAASHETDSSVKLKSESLQIEADVYGILTFEGFKLAMKSQCIKIFSCCDKGIIKSLFFQEGNDNTSPF